MKNTKSILIIISCLLLASGVSGQAVNPNVSYYTIAKVIEGDGFKYRCDIDESERVTLYNANDKFTYTRLVNKDGSPIEAGARDGSIDLIEEETWSRSRSLGIVDSAFPARERAWVKGELLLVTMIIDSSTGKVIEVNFEFLKNTPFQQVPLSVFRKIELDLKREIWFNMTPAGKKLNYCMLFWVHEFK
jgi:hypothetical protein